MMGLLQTLTDLFDSIFRRSSPEVQKKQLLKKLDMEIKSFSPAICSGGILLPNFGEAVFTLYKYTRTLDNLFSATVSSVDVPRQHRFEAQLIMTGYNSEEQDILEALTYENRLQEIMEGKGDASREYDHQRHMLEKLIKALNTENFKKMDKDILELRRFVDFCHYNYLTFMQLFDHNFIPADFTYKPNYSEVEVSKAINLLEDLYYEIEGLVVNTTTASEVLALAKLKKGNDLTEGEEKEYISCLKKILFVVTKLIPPHKLKAIIRYGQENMTYEPKVATYSGSPRQDFANMLQERFNAEEQRIKAEVQEDVIAEEVAELFNNQELENYAAYNNENNKLLQENTSLSFRWVYPMRIIKTFNKVYLSESIRKLLNDIVIEGFFNNPNYKTSFAGIVYSVCEISDLIAEFEDSFETDKKNSISVLKGYILDSNKDKDFYKKLEVMVLSINNDANKLIQTVTSRFFSLYKELGELLADSKKPSSELIQNLKVLMLSSRNKENTSTLEKQYPNWKIFFEIMKNYAIINSGEKQS